MSRDNLAVSSVVSTVILTSVLMVIIVTSSFFANNVLTSNVESVQFEQAINTVLSVEKVARKLMFKPYSTGTVKTSFPTTDPYILDSGNLIVYVNESELTSVPAKRFEIGGGRSVGVSKSKDYLGDNSLMLTGFEGSLSHVHTYQFEGAWVSLDYDRVRCVYSGSTDLHNGTGLEPYNIVEITVVKLSSGELAVLERSRVFVENVGIELNQSESSGDFTIKAKLSDRETTIHLSDLGGNPGYRTLINLTVICLKISILGGG